MSYLLLKVLPTVIPFFGWDEDIENFFEFRFGEEGRVRTTSARIPEGEQSVRLIDVVLWSNDNTSTRNLDPNWKLM
jgi:hypothetical protein